MKLKPFYGTLLVAALLLVALGVVYLFEEPPPPPKANAVKERPIFVFEKQDMVRAEIKRADGSVIVLEETPEGWFLRPQGFAASTSMVNRLRHQLHDLTARAQVVDPEEAARYGLGKQAIEVQIKLRDGRDLHFLAGDPNPSGVSYYVQPLPGDTIYTVKKSAMDYLSMELDEFREHRFATFDSKDADQIEATLPDGRTFRMVRVSEQRWQLNAPVDMEVSLDEARSLLGRVAVLKADAFVADGVADADLAQWGLDQPRLRVTISFGTRPPITLRVGAVVPGTVEPRLAYMMVEGSGTVVTAKDGFIEDFSADPRSWRQRRFVGLDADDLAQVTLRLDRDPVENEAELFGEVRLKRVGDVWQWADGRPVPGSTPRRVAESAADLEADEFVEDAATDLSRYGLDKPMLTFDLLDDKGQQRQVLLGNPGPPRQDGEYTIQRCYAKMGDAPAVYLVDCTPLERAKDALREHQRKVEADTEKARRQEAMKEEGVNLPAEKAP